jgi:hypothetical protein
MGWTMNSGMKLLSEHKGLALIVERRANFKVKCHLIAKAQEIQERMTVQQREWVAEM